MVKTRTFPTSTVDECNTVLYPSRPTGLLGGNYHGVIERITLSSEENDFSHFGRNSAVSTLISVNSNGISRSFELDGDHRQVFKVGDEVSVHHKFFGVREVYNLSTDQYCETGFSPVLTFGLSLLVLLIPFLMN